VRGRLAPRGAAARALVAAEVSLTLGTGPWHRLLEAMRSAAVRGSEPRRSEARQGERSVRGGRRQDRRTTEWRGRHREGP